MKRLVSLVMVLVLLSIGYIAGSRHLLTPTYVMGADDCATFPQTGKQLCGRFLQYWQANGGLAQQGLPLTNTFNEVSSVNQQTYTVQYFERAVFELHPENAPPYDVLLSLLGREKYLAKYPGGDPSGGTPPAPPPSTAYPRTASSNAVQMTVHQVLDPGPTGQYTKPGAGNRYVAIDVTLKNIGGTTFSANKLYFRLRTLDGRDWTVTYVGIPEPQIALRDITAGQDTRGWITFELPIGLQLVNLTFDHALLKAPVTIPVTP